jgi:hypothetical protein
MEMDVLHWGGGSWKKTEALAWNANALTRAKTNVLAHARTWRGIRTDYLTSRCGREIRFAMTFQDWRGPEPAQALNRKKCPHQTERGWLVGARGTEWSEGTPLIAYFTIEVSSVNSKNLPARKVSKSTEYPFSPVLSKVEGLFSPV